MPIDVSDLMALFNFSAVNQFILSANLLFLLFSRPIMSVFNNGKEIDTKVSIFRILNFLFLISLIVDTVLENLDKLHTYDHTAMKLAYSAAVIYFGMFIFSFLAYMIRKRFGEAKTLEEERIYVDTYNSRLVEIILLFMIIMLSIYSIIQVWALTEMLEATGIFGVIIAFLAITNQVWFPDIYFGLVILNSEMLEDGHVIQMEGKDEEYIIVRLNFIYTILFNVRNNHRTLIRNSSLMNTKINNLSKRASVDGLRYAITYKLNYPKPHEDQEPEECLNNFRRAINRMFTEADESLRDENNEAKLRSSMPFEFALTDTADYALEYTLFYYLEALPNTKSTKTIRAYILKTRFLVNEAVHASATANGLCLSTPMLITHKEV